MICEPTRELLDAVIKQAVHDRRSAVTRGLVDEHANPIPVEVLKTKIRIEEYDVTSGLNWFFYHGGLEMALDMAGYSIPPETIERKSREPYG